MAKKRYTTTAVSFSGQEALLAEVKAAASAERRSVSNFICGILVDHLRKRAGVLHEGPDAAPVPPVNSAKSGSASMVQIGPHGEVSYAKPRRAKKSAAPTPPAPVEQLKH